MLIKVLDHRCWWLAGGYNLETGHEVASMVVIWWNVAFCAVIIVKETEFCTVVDYEHLRNVARFY